jgi:MFS family permease
MNRHIYYRIMMLFMISCAAALIYQVCWQRLLFESVGVDIESVTIIVSTFMLGLGLGALVGGELADRFPDWTLAMFGIIELATAAFGALSSYLIHSVSLAVIHASTAQAHLDPVEDFLVSQKTKAGVITDDNLLSEYAHGQRFGPELLRALAPPEVPHF